jgi:hypothetical protein
MVLGPLRRRSQEWGWGDPPESPDIPIEPGTEFYVNDETAAAAVYLLNDPKFSRKINKWVQKRFKETHSPDLIRQELATNFMNQLLNGINKLPSPYKDLAAVSLEKINWESLADPYIDPISGPKYMTEEEEIGVNLEEFEEARKELPEDIQEELKFEDLLDSYEEEVQPELEEYEKKFKEEKSPSRRV